MPKRGLILINIGTPEKPTPYSVARYLREFLMDPRVIDIPFPLRWILVNLLILPFRSSKSAKLYQKVWTSQGSPLLKISRDFKTALQNTVSSEWSVKLGMRYGKPSLKAALKELAEENVEDLYLLPLYPQDSMSAKESSVEEVMRLNQGRFRSVSVFPSFFNEPAFIRSVTEIAKEHLSKREHDIVLFSYHGLPERHILKANQPIGHCLQKTSCCDSIHAKNLNCYRAQCFETSRLIAEALGLERYEVAFQSRLGRTPWISPYSDKLYESLPKEGIKRLAVICPSFVADCLETLEEVQIRGRKSFIEAGGEDLFLIPCVNASTSWVNSVKEWMENPQRFQRLDLRLSADARIMAQESLKKV